MKNKTKVLLFLIAFLCVAGYGYYYYFVQTLRLSDIIGSQDNPIASMLVNLVDFDTGLTRYDLHDLSQNAPYWNRRMNEVESLPPGYQKQVQQQQLVAEMMKDPAMKKIINRLMPFGFNAVQNFFKALM
ncbi:MAG: hypothetical protein M1470_00905 [Bacteroidetes bacterium]|nr:hypothetical protein [Bacteroidota bacterium]